MGQDSSELVLPNKCNNFPINEAITKMEIIITTTRTSNILHLILTLHQTTRLQTDHRREFPRALSKRPNEIFISLQNNYYGADAAASPYYLTRHVASIIQILWDFQLLEDNLYSSASSFQGISRKTALLICIDIVSREKGYS